MRRLTVGVSALALLGSTACQDYLFTVKIPETIKEQQVVVPAAEPTPADILFVVDNSCSMEDEQENLAANFDAFINEIAGTGDYRIAIVSTDVSTGGADGQERAGFRRSTFKATSPRTLTGIDDADCRSVPIQHGCFRGPGSVESRVISSEQPNDQQINLFKQNIDIGSCGSGTESGLAAMLLALQNTAAGRCNEGFLRQDANLVVIFVSDENDQESGQLQPVGTYVDAIKQFKGGDASKIRVAAIVGSRDGVASNCRQGGPTCGDTCNEMLPPGSGVMGCIQTPSLCASNEFCDRNTDSCRNEDLQQFQFCHWCSFYDTDTCCSALSGDRYIQFTSLMEGEIVRADSALTATNCQVGGVDERIACLVDSVCQANFSETLQKIARDLVSNTGYDLDPPACNPAGVVVKVNGRELVNGTDYVIEQGGSRLNFRAGGPSSDENVEIFYVVPNDASDLTSCPGRTGTSSTS